MCNVQCAIVLEHESCKYLQSASNLESKMFSGNFDIALVCLLHTFCELPRVDHVVVIWSDCLALVA